MNRFGSFLPGQVAMRPIAALAVLCVTAWLCAWAIGGADRSAGAAAADLADELRSAVQPLRLVLRGGPGSANAGYEANARPVLAGLDAAASRAGVQVTRLTPRPAEPGTVDVELLAEYQALVRFVAQSEALGGTVKSLQIRPAEGAAAPRLLVTFAIEMGAHPLRASGMAQADDVPAAAGAALHPFQAAQAAADRDVSERYHLTGITRLGTELMATIGGRDYVVGDQIDGMQVARISEADVHLAGPGCVCLLRFRPSAR